MKSDWQVETKMGVEFKLQFGHLTVGRIREAFESDCTWHGRFQQELQANSHELAPRLIAFIEFCQGWNERLRRHDEPVDAVEFDQFTDIVKSHSWFTRNRAGIATPIKDAPVFFANGDVTWSTAEVESEDS